MTVLPAGPEPPEKKDFPLGYYDDGIAVPIGVALSHPEGRTKSRITSLVISLDLGSTNHYVPSPSLTEA